jgi:hypothetical protein
VGSREAEGRHDDAVGQGEVADLQGLEEGHLGYSATIWVIFISGSCARRLSVAR